MDLSVNTRIKELRNSLGISQAKFAKRIAISSSYVAEIETHKKPASERVVRLIVAEYKVNNQWLRTGNGSMFSDELDAQIANLVSMFTSLSPVFKVCALNQINELAALDDHNIKTVLEQDE